MPPIRNNVTDKVWEICPGSGEEDSHRHGTDITTTKTLPTRTPMLRDLDSILDVIQCQFVLTWEAESIHSCHWSKLNLNDYSLSKVAITGHITATEEMLRNKSQNYIQAAWERTDTDTKQILQRQHLLWQENVSSEVFKFESSLSVWHKVSFNMVTRVSPLEPLFLNW